MYIDNADIKALKALDPILSDYIDNTPIPERFYAKSFFISAVQSIVSQLISKKSAATIYSRLEVLLGEVNEANYLDADEADIIACGIYKKKYDQIYNIAKSLESGILDAQDLSSKSDEEVIKILTAYPGIGLWTAEMIMMHGLKRTNILAFGDFGIRSGIMNVYNLDALSKEEFNLIKERLSPFGTLASLYFWQAHAKE